MILQHAEPKKPKHQKTTKCGSLPRLYHAEPKKPKNQNTNKAYFAFSCLIAFISSIRFFSSIICCWVS